MTFVLLFKFNIGLPGISVMFGRAVLTNREDQYVKENDVDVRKVVETTLRERRGEDVDMA